MDKPVKTDGAYTHTPEGAAIDLMERIFIVEGKTVHKFGDGTTREEILSTYVSCFRVVWAARNQQD